MVERRLSVSERRLDALRPRSRAVTANTGEPAGLTGRFGLHLDCSRYATPLRP
jgi:hypothetical protein